MVAQAREVVFMDDFKEKLEKVYILPEEYQKALCGIIELFLEMAEDEKGERNKRGFP